MSAKKPGPSDFLESLAKLGFDMLNPASTCRACDFKVCPMLSVFGHRLLDLVRKNKNGQPDGAKSRILAYQNGKMHEALQKIAEATAGSAEAHSPYGYIYRKASQALAQCDVVDV